MAIVGEKKGVRPLLLQLGVALALSFAGFLYSRFKTKRIGPSQPPPSPQSSDCGSGVDLGGDRAGLRDGLRALQTTPSSCNIAPIAAEEYGEACLQKDKVDNFLVDLSSSSKNSGDKDRVLLPEFKEIMKEFDLVAMNSGISLSQDVETLASDVEKPIAFRTAEKDEYEQEINQLRSMVRGLRERERNLEVQLLEYYGLQEQETTVMELQNRLNFNNTEFKLLNLKIESLQADKQRLEAQLADYPTVVAELEGARAKIKLLEQKLRSEAERNRKQIFILKQRVEKFQDQEHKAANSDPDIQLKLKDLENEAEELRNSNIKLQLENSELAERLESTQILASSVLEHPEVEEAKKLSHCLRQENEDLSKKIEQLQADRCADVEELVYLRWLNACLRYELRNYELPDGRTVAKDLSNTLSPKSEEKAKKLILEYGYTEGIEEKVIDIMDFDSDLWSSSQGDSSEFDDSSAFNSSATRTSSSKKTKFLSKLRRLIRGKDHHHHDQVSTADKAASPEMLPTCSDDSLHCNSAYPTGIDAKTAGNSNRFTALTPSSFRHSLDIQRLKSLNVEDFKELERARRYSDTGHFNAYKRIILGGEAVNDSPVDANHKSSLVKYAEALSHSHGGKPSHRKSKSVPIGSY